MVSTSDQARRLAALDKAIPGAEQLVKTREAELPETQKRWENEAAARAVSMKEPEDLVARFTFDETLEGEWRDAKFTGLFKGTSNAPVWGVAN